MATSALGAAGISAGVAATVGLITLWVAGLRQERARRRELYANALAATMAYREFPYAIRRRRHEDDHRSSERVRISESLREIQGNLSQYEALMRIERADEAAKTYRQLVLKTREIAGTYMNDGWKGEPITTDAEMNMGAPFDYSALMRYEDDYLDAVREDLAWWRIWR